MADDLQSRYALGSHTTLYLSDLDNPQVTSSDPEIVAVGPIEDDETDEYEDKLVELSFVGAGTAILTISEAGESLPADVPIEVAAFERFEVVLPTVFYRDPVAPLAGRTVIDPEFEVIYYDRDGRLYGQGLAQTEWAPAEDLPGDSFFNDTLDSGPHQVEVRAGHRASVIPFAAVARDEVVALELLETRLDENLIRLELVGLTKSGTPVWNIDPILSPQGGGLYFGSFEYLHDPDARPIRAHRHFLRWISGRRAGPHRNHVSGRADPRRKLAVQLCFCRRQRAAHGVRLAPADDPGTPCQRGAEVDMTRGAWPLTHICHNAPRDSDRNQNPLIFW